MTVDVFAVFLANHRKCPEVHLRSSLKAQDGFRVSLVRVPNELSVNIGHREALLHSASISLRRLKSILR